MKYLRSSRPIKIGLRVALLWAILLANFSPGATLLAYAAPPTNDDFASATVISAIPFTSSINTTDAADAGDGPTVNQLCDGNLLAKGHKNVWYRYTPAITAKVNVDALGSKDPLGANYDTYIAVWKGPDINHLTLVACDDDNPAGLQSQMVFGATAGTTYYIEVAQFNGYQGGTPTPPTGGSLIVHVRKPANVKTYVAGVLKGQNIFAQQSSVKRSYTGLKNGPVKVRSITTVPIAASQRFAYSPDGGTTWTSYAEMMGLPSNQLTTSYTFPYYDNTVNGLVSQLSFANLGTAPTTVKVRVGNVTKASYPLAPNAVQQVIYPGFKGGPIQVNSSGNVPIVASLRVYHSNGSALTSYAEMMGLPSKKLTSRFWFPYYDNTTSIRSQLRIANLGTASTNVKITIGSTIKGPITIAPKTTKIVAYALSGGPVKVQSTGNVPIIASMRFAYTPGGGVWTDAAEMMGQPANSLSTRYSFPIYDTVHHNSQLRFANLGAATNHVTVTINGVLKNTYTLAPNAVQSVNLPNLDGGPVVVQSLDNLTIVASKRVAYTPDGGATWTSFSELMGLPQSQVVKIYYFPWYNNVDTNSLIAVGSP